MAPICLICRKSTFSARVKLASLDLDPGEIAKILRSLTEKSDGNPLYARYLCVGLMSGLDTGDISNPSDWLQTLPEIHGQISEYYSHIYKGLIQQAQYIADLFGAIDFSITEEELREIVPTPLLGWVKNAIRALAPVLTCSVGQGGMRVFHESFRRFMFEEMKQTGRSIGVTLKPVISWLEKMGFYGSSKSFRFLIPVLSRAGNTSQIFSLVESSFVAKSVGNGHSYDAIQKNVVLSHS